MPPPFFAPVSPCPPRLALNEIAATERLHRPLISGIFPTPLLLLLVPAPLGFGSASHLHARTHPHASAWSSFRMVVSLAGGGSALVYVCVSVALSRGAWSAHYLSWPRKKARVTRNVREVGQPAAVFPCCIAAGCSPASGKNALR